jgi:hypothetical protein
MISKTVVLLSLFIFSFMLSCCQARSRWTLTISYDTIPRKDRLLSYQRLKNNGDTITLVADFNFNNDIVSIYTDGSKFSKRFLTDRRLGLAGHMFLPKAPQMQVSINNSPAFKINLDSQYSTVHLYLKNKHITWTYTNRLYTYE